MGVNRFFAQYKQSAECLNMIEEVREVTNVNTEKSHVGPDAPVRAASIACLALDFDLG